MTFLDTLRSLDKAATPGPWSMSYEASSIGAGQNGVRLLLSRPGVSDSHDGPVFAHAVEHTPYATAQTRRYVGHAIQFDTGQDPDYPTDLRLIIALRNAAPALAAVIEAAQHAVRLYELGPAMDRVGPFPESMRALRAALAALDKGAK